MAWQAAVAPLRVFSSTPMNWLQTQNRFMICRVCASIWAATHAEISFPAEADTPVRIHITSSNGQGSIWLNGIDLTGDVVEEGL